MKHLSLNLRGRLYDLDTPLVMGILNLTPDSFFSASRCVLEKEVLDRAGEIVSQGAAVIDVGACSTRPGSTMVDQQEEMRRLRLGLDCLVKAYPDVPLSVDTFRADVARMCVEEYGAAVINDIAAGEMDARMFETVAALHVPYIAMHMRGTPETMQNYCAYEDLVGDVICYFSEKISRLSALGVADIILDPGFGFSKTLEQNYRLLAHLGDLSIFELPILAGLSRKSMICRELGVSPDQALNGTTVLNMAALERGAHILRVHDVREAVETVRLFKAIGRNESY